jgi:hypothetical protein
MRVLKLAWLTSLIAVLGLALAGPALAVDEVPATVQPNNGRVEVPFSIEGNCNGVIALDVQYGFLNDADPQADVARAFVRVTRLTGTLRVQVNRLRLRADSLFTDDRRPKKELLAPADPLNSAEEGNPVNLRAGSDWNDSDAADDYDSLDLGDDGIPAGVVPATFTFNTASNVSARVDVGVRCSDGSGFTQSVVTGVSHPPTN